MNGLYWLNKKGLIKVPDFWERVLTLCLAVFLLGLGLGYLWAMTVFKGG